MNYLLDVLHVKNRENLNVLVLESAFLSVGCVTAKMAGEF